MWIPSAGRYLRNLFVKGIVALWLYGGLWQASQGGFA
jgi:hypothetical protein